MNVVANLPYNITKLALRQMLPLSERISHLHFMLQARSCHASLPGCCRSSRGGTDLCYSVMLCGPCSKPATYHGDLASCWAYYWSAC